jgi:hypothetical protein
MASVIGAALNVIPFFFYDLTETRQKAMVSVLRLRAYFEDAMNGTSTDEQKTEFIKIINDAKIFSSREKTYVNKKLNRAEKKKIREENEQIEISRVILDELNYFDTPSGQFELEYSRSVLESNSSTPPVTLSQIKSLPANTVQEKEFRRKMISSLKDFKVAQKTMNKQSYKSIDGFDNSIFAELFGKLNEIEKEIKALQDKIKKEKTEKTDASESLGRLSQLRKEKELLNKEIKIANKKNILYNRANKPFLDAKKCLARYESYRHYNIIK